MPTFRVEVPVAGGTFTYTVTAASKSKAIKQAMEGSYDDTEYDLELEWDEADAEKEEI